MSMSSASGAEVIRRTTSGTVDPSTVAHYGGSNVAFVSKMTPEQKRYYGDMVDSQFPPD